MKPPTELQNRSRRESTRPSRNLVMATVAVTAVYAYFLIFAQFGFLHALTDALGEGHTLLRVALAVMGLAGIAGSVFIARGPGEVRARMTVGFALAGGAAALTYLARTPAVFFVAAGLAGAGTGMITVGLAGMLRRETGDARLGMCIGCGTGLAYAICNLPAVFGAGARDQSLMGVGAAMIGWMAVRGFTQRAAPPAVLDFDYTPPRVARWTLALLALVAFDSAVFYHIQHVPSLKESTWSGSVQLFVNAGSHLLAGLLTGLALDRRWAAMATRVAMALLVVATMLILSGQGSGGVLLYTAGVSIYSAVLVFYPARSGRLGLAAWIYASAGWAGSALGIGAVEQMGTIPAWWLVMTPLTVIGALWFRARNVQ